MNSNTLLPLALDMLAKSSGILLLAFAVNSLRRTASAAQRCLVWGAAFAVLLLLPLALLVPPRWAFALEQAQPPHPSPVTVSHFEVAPNSAEGRAEESLTVVRRFPRLDAAQIAFVVWTAGVLLLLGRRALGEWQVRRLRSMSGVLNEGRITALATKLARESGIRRRIELRKSTRISVPLTWGVFRPVLLLPHEALSWLDGPMEAALRHEFGHVRHGDAFTRLAACVAGAFFWPNPLAWFAARAWRTAQEQACDDLVLRAGAGKEDYAMQLLNAARCMKADAFRHAPVMAMARPSTLETRLAAIMDDTRDRRPVRRLAWFAGGGAVVLALGLSGALQVRATDKPAPEDEKAPFIAINMKIFEVSSRKDSGASPPEAFVATKEKPVLMTTQKAEAFIAEMSRKKGVEMLTAPRVLTKNGQQVIIESSRDFLAPDGKPDAAPKNQKVGMFLTLLPRLDGKDGMKIDFEGVVREFEGYRDDPDSRKKVPVFTERKTETQLNLRRGETAILGGQVRTDGKRLREVIYLIRTDVVPQNEVPALNNQGSATLTPDGKTHTVTDKRGSNEPENTLYLEISTDELRLFTYQKNGAGELEIRWEPCTEAELPALVARHVAANPRFKNIAVVSQTALSVQKQKELVAIANDLGFPSVTFTIARVRPKATQ